MQKFPSFTLLSGKVTLRYIVQYFVTILPLEVFLCIVIIYHTGVYFSSRRQYKKPGILPPLLPSHLIPVVGLSRMHASVFIDTQPNPFLVHFVPHFEVQIVVASFKYAFT